MSQKGHFTRTLAVIFGATVFTLPALATSEAMSDISLPTGLTTVTPVDAPEDLPAPSAIASESEASDSISTSAASETEVEPSVTHAPEFLFHSSESGGYISIDTKATEISDGTGTGYDAFLLGGRAAWQINSEFAMGVAGYHLMNDMRNTDPYQANAATPGNFYDNKLSMTYGGLFGEYSFANWSLFHPSASLLVGVGGAQISARDGSDSNSMFFYVTEPQLNGIINLSPAVRAGLSVSYRLVRCANDGMVGYDGSNLNGFAGGVFIQAGKF